MIMRYAVSDIGSNTIRIAVYETEGKMLKTLYNDAVFANLAGEIHNNQLTDVGIEKAAATLLAQKKIADSYESPFYPFATAAVRNAENTREICEKIRQLTGLSVDVLSGEEEAQFSFYGAYPDFQTDSGVMADVGGGSSEFVLFSQGKIIDAVSVPWGSLKLYKAYVAETLPTKREAAAITELISRALCEAFGENPKKTFTHLCLVGGGVRASARLANKVLDESAITVSGVSRLLDYAVGNSSEAEKTFSKHCAKRLTTITPALCVYRAAAVYFGADRLSVSDKGIKEGYVVKRLLKWDKTEF